MKSRVGAFASDAATNDDAMAPALRHSRRTLGSPLLLAANCAACGMSLAKRLRGITMTNRGTGGADV
jgi:hypothetical protein